MLCSHWICIYDVASYLLNTAFWYWFAKIMSLIRPLQSKHQNAFPPVNFWPTAQATTQRHCLQPLYIVKMVTSTTLPHTQAKDVIISAHCRCLAHCTFYLRKLAQMSTDGTCWNLGCSWLPCSGGKHVRGPTHCNAWVPSLSQLDLKHTIHRFKWALHAHEQNNLSMW
jgi:hypothetical protein